MILIASPGGVREKGGIGRVVDTIATELASRHPHLRFRVIDTYGPGRFWLMPLWAAGALTRLAVSAATERPQLLHVHMAERGSVVRKGALMALARLLGIPVVLHLHAGQFHEQFERAGPVQRWLLRAVIGLAGEMVVLGSFYRDFAVRTFSGLGTRISILPNAVPAPVQAPDHVHPGPTRLLFLGRLVPVKGLPVLFEALAQPALKEREWTLTVVGDGERVHYEDLVAKHGLTRRVRFTGWLHQDACRRELAAADVLVQPSFAEGLPMAVLEAMAHALPVVATPVGSVADAVTEGETGLIVPTGAPSALADALVRLIDDADLRRRLGTRARAEYERQFTLALYTERLLDIYRRNARHWPDAPVVRRREATLP